MKKSFVFFLVVFLSLLCLSCDNGDCRIEGIGEIYLTILNEDGQSFSDSEAGRFKVHYSGPYGKASSIIINEKDELMLSLGTIRLEYYSCKRLKEKEGFTDSEILNALTDDLTFSIRDIKDPSEYKTIANKSCKSCLVKFERTNVHPATYVSSDTPTHIYYCQVRLEKR